MSHMHGSNGLRRRSLLQEGRDRLLMQTGFKKVLELWKDLINIGCKLNFQPSLLLDGAQHTHLEIFSDKVSNKVVAIVCR